MVKTAILLRHIGPYHQVRLEALSKLCDLAVFAYGDMADVAYGEFEGDRSYRYFPQKDVFTKPFAGVQKFLETIQPDIVAVPGWAEPSARIGLRWSLRHHTPVVVFSDSQEKDLPRMFWKEWVKSRIVHLFAAAQVAGKSHVQYITKLGLPVERVFTGCDVVDNEYFHIGAEAARAHKDKHHANFGLPEKFFLASNRFLPRKNVLGIIEAYAQYRQNGAPGDWGLVLLGDGQGRCAIEAASDKLNLGGHIVMCGMRPYAELPVYYGLAGAFVHASFSEQWGLVINEAMAAGLPILVSDRCGCVPDLVCEGGNGYSFDPHDIQCLATHMTKMANGDYDLNAMGEMSKQIISVWTPEVFAEHFMRAAKKAIELPLPKFGLVDSLLLKGLCAQ